MYTALGRSKKLVVESVYYMPEPAQGLSNPFPTTSQSTHDYTPIYTYNFHFRCSSIITIGELWDMM